ncbi:hypothetical protein GCM10023088_81720 [Actinomadura verrucosospora]|uniref:hypothetical protein n=1 Tax=Actinomadura verrucosospora TaxID=46165 RepID=UPI00338199FA
MTLPDAFEGRRQPIAYYMVWSAGRPAAEQCDGCTYFTWEDSPEGRPREGSVDGGFFRTDGRPTAQWPRLKAGHSDTLT